MADHPLRPATDHCLGRPLPHQLANPTRAPPRAINLSPVITHRAHAVLAEVSLGYPPQQGRFPRATHPCATPLGAEAPRSVRLACVKHAASVRSEPGSNSHVHPELPPLKDNPKIILNRATRLTGPPNARTILPVRARSSTIAPPPAHPFLSPQCQSTKPEPADKTAIAATSGRCQVLAGDRVATTPRGAGERLR